MPQCNSWMPYNSHEGLFKVLFDNRITFELKISSTWLKKVTKVMACFISHFFQRN